MPYRDDIEVGLLIGTNFPKAIKPREVIPGADHDPYGIKTDLGWGIIGRVCKSPPGDYEDSPRSWTNRIVSREETSFALETRTREIISPACVKPMFERDFQEIVEPKSSYMRAPSVDDRRFLEILVKGIHKTSDGHYKMPLPLRSQDVKLTSNKSLAFRRLFTLFKRDPSFPKDYTDFMEETIKNCAEEGPLEERNNSAIREGKINYVPHHGIYHPKNASQIRVVFDCSATYKGTPLNKNLLSGPDMTNSLTGVLRRFRQEWVAVTCDVKGMFHQFFVNKQHRDLLRFF